MIQTTLEHCRGCTAYDSFTSTCCMKYERTSLSTRKFHRHLLHTYCRWNHFQHCKRTSEQDSFINISCKQIVLGAFSTLPAFCSTILFHHLSEIDCHTKHFQYCQRIAAHYNFTKHFQHCQNSAAQHG